MNFEDLKNQVAALEAKNKKTINRSKYDLDIIDLEDYLRSLGETCRFQINLSAILGDALIGDRFKSSEYQLDWMPNIDKHRLCLVNIPYKNKKLLINCPELHKEALFKDKEKLFEAVKATLK